MASTVDRLFAELQRFFEPLGLALSSHGELAAFLRRFGYAFDGDDVADVVGQLAPMRASMVRLVATTRAAVANGLDAADVVAIADAAQPVFEGFDSLHAAVTALAPPGALSPEVFARGMQEFPDELFNILLTDYLATYWPLALHALVLLDVVGTDQIPEEDDPRARGASYSVTVYRWDRLRLLFEDASEWAGQAYGWGVAFDSETVILRLVRIFEYLGGLAETREMSEGQAAVLMPHLATSPVKPSFALAPIVRTRSTPPAGDGGFEAMNEFGLALLPVAPPGDPADAGLAVAPYTEGQIAQTIQLRDEISLALTGAIGAIGGVVFCFRPSGASHEIGLDGALVSGTGVGMRLRYEPKSTVVLVGRAGGTRLQIAAAEAGLTFDVSGGLVEVAASLETRGLSLVIGASDPDAFIGDALAGKETEIPFPFSVRWSNKTGLGVQGLRFDATVSPNLSIGPIRVETLSIAVYGEQPQGEATRAVLEVGAGLSGALGPVAFSIEGVGLRMTVTFEDGNLGPLDIDHGFKPPTGMGLAVNTPVVTGGGYLFFDADKGQYAGIVLLTVEGGLTLTAIGLISTRLPSGARGFSFLVIITAEGFKPIPLGLGFTLTGVGGLLAVNRTCNEEFLRVGLKNKTLDAVLFPADPIRNAAQILSTFDSAFPARRGSFLFGPVMQIRWGTPPVVTMNLAAVLELGNRTRLIVLGRVSALMPSEKNDLVRLQMSAIGVIDFDQHTISLDAVLYDSRLAGKFPVTGSMALRVNWGSNRVFALSMGGFHPAFKPPPAFPALERLAITFSNSTDFMLRAEKYVAITSNTLQFGAKVELFARAGGFAIAGMIGYDVLVQFDPFAFVADFQAAVQLKYHSKNLFKVSVAGELSGPRPLHIRGKASFEIFWCDISVRFDKTLVSGERPARLPPVNVTEQLVTAFNDTRNWGGQLSQADRSTVTLRGLTTGDTIVLHPLGRLSVKQTVVPLELDIAKFGNATPAGARRFNIGPVTMNGGGVSFDRVQDFFAPAQFLELSDDEKLTAPSFEPMVAGVSIGQQTVQFSGNDQDILEDDTMLYETVLIDGEAPPAAPAASISPDFLDRYLSLGAASTSVLRRSGEAKYRVATRENTLKPAGWTIASREDGSAQAAPGVDAGAIVSYSSVFQALTTLRQKNQPEARSLMLVRTTSPS
jgi:hypothetical protein